MFEHISYHKDWAVRIKNEIDNNELSGWYDPKGLPYGQPGIGHFDYGHVKFINRNLNYYYFENMISHAMKNQYLYNSDFPDALNFCNFSRSVLNEYSPFGRMCIWKLTPKSFLAPHYDRWTYHFYISRYIFCVSDQENEEALIKIRGKEIKVSQGLLFNFTPTIDEHEFINYSNRDWNFIGIDFWKPELLESASKKYGITSETKILYQEGYGSKMQKYLSEH